MKHNSGRQMKDNSRKLSYQVKGKTYYIQVDGKDQREQDEHSYIEEPSFIHNLSESVGGAAPFLTDSMVRWILFIMPPFAILVTIILMIALYSNL